MPNDEPRLEVLWRLARSRDVADRAFASSALVLCAPENDPDEITELYELIRETASREHADVRGRIQDGNFDRGAFIAELEKWPLATRDHLVEEILDIAYPPLERHGRPSDASRYAPSGIREISFTLAHADVEPGTTLVDLGSGFGKVVLLTALLTDADAYGLELDPRLVAHAKAAASSLGLTRAHFLRADLREVDLPKADTYYQFIPFDRPADVIARLAPLAAVHAFQVFSQPLDERRVPFLRATVPSSYWLTRYETRSRATRSPSGSQPAERSY
jgi:SAM-dependent methyltransferase